MERAGAARDRTLPAQRFSDHSTTEEKGPKIRGFKYKNNVIDYQTEFLPKYLDMQGADEGLTYKQGPRASEDTRARTEFDPVGMRRRSLAVATSHSRRVAS